MNTALIIFSLILGAAVGSFLNVVIFRTISGESIMFPPSHCPECGHRLLPHDLIPVLSYITLRGKCRYCGTKISAQYPAVEAATALLFALTAARYGFAVKTIIYFIAISTLIAVAIIDLKTREVFYHTLYVPGFIIALIMLIGGGKGLILSSLAGIFAGSLPLLLFYLIGAMGEGDLAVGAFIGLCFGMYGAVKALFFAFILGGIYSAWLIYKNPGNLKAKVPFAPFLALGAAAAMFF